MSETAKFQLKPPSIIYKGSKVPDTYSDMVRENSTTSSNENKGPLSSPEDDCNKRYLFNTDTLINHNTFYTLNSINESNIEHQTSNKNADKPKGCIPNCLGDHPWYREHYKINWINMALLDVCSSYTISLAAVGVICSILLFLDTFCNFIKTLPAILPPYFQLQEPQTLCERFGSWALITGSTDGIGKAYAKELARRGINLVLVSRTEAKLRTTAKEIESEYAVKTKIIAADFSMGLKAVDVIKDELDDVTIGILVNNVGKQYTYPMFLGEVPEQELWDIININVGAVTMMTRMLIQGMRERGRGAVVNVSSGAECQPLPLMNVYAASKVYVKYFTEALRQEYSKDGLTIQHLSPFFINTKMNQFSDRLQETSLFVPDAPTFAKYAVATLGKVDHSTGYWAHGIQYFFTTLAPMWLRMRIGGRINKAFREDYFRQNKKASGAAGGFSS